MTIESVTTVEAIVARMLEVLPRTRYPSADATWAAGVEFAQGWAELSGDEHALTLTPRGQECTLTVTIGPWDEKDDLAALLARVRDHRVSQDIEGLARTIERVRGQYADDFDFQRRNIPASASELERDQLKDPYVLSFLGLEPLDGDPTIEDVEREFEDDED